MIVTFDKVKDRLTADPGEQTGRNQCLQVVSCGEAPHNHQNGWSFELNGLESWTM